MQNSSKIGYFWKWEDFFQQILKLEKLFLNYAKLEPFLKKITPN